MATQTITEAFCGWPYFVPYSFEQKIPRKKRVKKVATLAKKPRKPRKKKV